MAKKTGPSRAFTLIELLVVIAIIALLIGLLLPGLNKAKLAAKSLKEQAVGHQMGTAMAAYYSESKDKLLPGGCHWAWNHAPANFYSIFPPDPFTGGRTLEGSTTKAWGLYFVGNANFNLEGLMLDKPTFQEFYRRSQVSTPGADAGFWGYADTAAGTAFGWHPSLGMNAVYVGGSYSQGAFRGQRPGGTWGDPTPNGNPRVSGGQFYVQRAADVRMPARLIQFGSARGGDVSGSGYWGYGATKPDTGTVRPGYWLIAPPTPHPLNRGAFQAAYTLGWGWSASNKFNPAATPGTWGMMDMRYDGRAVTVRMDASVALESLETLRDMTKWSNVADRPDWTFPTTSNNITW